MKILVDEMPTKVKNCPWSNPIKDPWKDRTIWFCDWSLSYNETCPMAKWRRVSLFCYNKERN